MWQRSLPIRLAKVKVFTLVARLYEAEEYRGEAIVQSQLEALMLTAEQVLRSQRYAR
ncbi:hypothetical protein H6F76_21035 [Leptolyngbya sp. FACHB-321]|uniref:hypothetical protein n=1 Tax=Leptolyngbya sp. FACHB-321 TaxID=2692807 RepID=UPI0016847BEB|nr:hypothetical protein [Leptolyngbya sp. FACHB-321]MBD2037450.1 hypothetical protein [Leptolyngbya sp. FACHB-321]